MNQPQYIKNADLNSNQTKNKILRYLYSSGIDTHKKYQAIANESDINTIKFGDYTICPRFTGTPSWIIFFRTGNHYYAVNFPKYRKKDNYIIHPVEMNVSIEFYYGTIMEGIFFRIDDKKYLVVDEVYLLAGNNELVKPKDDRLANLKEYFKTSISINPFFYMYVSQYYGTDKNSLKDLYDKIRSDTKIQEIIFYPKLSNGKIYTYTILDTDLADNITKISNLFLHKTASTDVYHLVSITGNKIGIAYIPDMQTSKMCKQWFKDYKSKQLLVKCRLDSEQNKWVPMELVENDLDDDMSSDQFDDSDSDDSDSGVSGESDNSDDSDNGNESESDP